MKLAIVGTGYVGLVQAAVFASTGNHVICVDIDENKVESLRAGRVPFYEPELEELVRSNLKEERLEFTTSLDHAVKRSDIIFLCLPTPSSTNGAADLTAVFSVVEQIAVCADREKLLVCKSTVPVGTVDTIRQNLASRARYPIEVVSNPEFLKEGSAVQDCFKPDRVVIGTQNAKVVETLRELYEPFVRTGNPVIVMDACSAEMTKYAANAFLATKISFMNELANFCERVGADIEAVRKGIGADPRIGKQFIFPGVGYGGSCFPKDVRALIHLAEEHGQELKILKAVHAVNEEQKRLLVNKLAHHFDHDLRNKTVALWGLSFKPKTDDIREAPSLTIIKGLVEMGVTIRAHDPAANVSVKETFDGALSVHQNSYDALKGADALVVVTEWNEFRQPDFERMKKLMNQPVVFDGRNIYDPKEMRSRGFVYYGIGRKEADH